MPSLSSILQSFSTFCSTLKKYVCLTAGGGNGTNHKDHPPLKAYSTYIYPIDNLKRPVTGYAAGAYPRAVGIDSKSNCILAHNFGKPLLIYSFATDTKLGEYDFKPLKGGTTSEFSVSPLGSEAIARTEGGGIVHIKINKAGPPIKASLDQRSARDPIARVSWFDGTSEPERQRGIPQGTSLALGL